MNHQGSICYTSTQIKRQAIKVSQREEKKNGRSFLISHFSFSYLTNKQVIFFLFILLASKNLLLTSPRMTYVSMQRAVTLIEIPSSVFLNTWSAFLLLQIDRYLSDRDREGGCRKWRWGCMGMWGRETLYRQDYRRMHLAILFAMQKEGERRDSG